MVAEKNSVWRSAGSSVMIFLMVGRKPMSSMRSASSSTRMRTPRKLHQLALEEIGQAAGRGDQHLRAAADRVCSCGCSLMPPTTTAARMPVCLREFDEGFVDLDARVRAWGSGSGR